MAAGSCQQQRELMPAARAAGRERQAGLVGRSSVRSPRMLASRSSCLWPTQVVIPTTSRYVQRLNAILDELAVDRMLQSLPLAIKDLS
jgi:hypothetical protein